MVKVQCILDYNDLQLKRLEIRAEELEGLNYVVRRWENGTIW